jgi:hypothetical protein
VYAVDVVSIVVRDFLLAHGIEILYCTVCKDRRLQVAYKLIHKALGCIEDTIHITLYLLK